MALERPAEAERKSGVREWIGLVVLTLPLFVLALDMSVLFLATPHMSADLQPAATELLWILDIYGFLIAGFLVTMGALGDRIGRRKLLLIGAVAFALASILAAYAVSSVMLIAARAVLGVAGATLMPSTLALIRNMFLDPGQRGVAIAIWTTAFTAGMASGPFIGGVLLESFWWGSVFLIAVPVMVLLLVAGPFLLPEYRAPQSGNLDLASVALSLATILPIVYGIKKLATGEVGVLSWVGVIIGLGAGAVFVRRQKGLVNPMLDVRLFGNRAVTASLLMLVVGVTAATTVPFLFPQVLQVVHELSPLRAGLWMLIVTLAATTSSLLAPFVARRVRPAYVMLGGTVVAGTGFAVTSHLDTTTAIPVLMAAGAATLFGISPISVMSTDLTVSSAPREQAGSAAALSETGSELGAGLGIALLGSIMTAVYQDRMVLPNGLTRQAAEAATGSPGGAVAAADGLPVELREALLRPAQDALVAGVNAAAMVSLALLVILAAVASSLLRHVPATRNVEVTRAD